MWKDIRFKLPIFPVLAIFTAFGCLPGTRTTAVSPKTKAMAPLPLSVQVVDEKIAHLTRILEDRELNTEDREIASDLLSAYKTVSSSLHEQSTNRDYDKIIHILFTNLSRLDEQYFLKREFDRPRYAKALSLFSLKRKKILDHFLSEDYKGVIDECVELEAVFGPDSLTPEIGLLFALSLAKKGMVKEAANISEKIIRELEGKPDLMQLRAHLVQWQIDLGNRDRAWQTYEKLMDDLDEKEALLTRSRLVVMGEQEVAYPKQGPAERSSRDEGLIQEQGPMEDLLKEVDELLKQGKFERAKFLLIKRKIRVQEGPEMEILDQALKNVDRMEKESYQAEKQGTLTRQKEALILAKKLIEEEKFEEVLQKLGHFATDQEMPPEMRALKELATEKLINRERNRAAKYFLMARRATDPTKKEQLLLSSYEILKVLVERYPTSGLIEKVNDHMRKVRMELYKLGKNPEN